MNNKERVRKILLNNQYHVYFERTSDERVSFGHAMSANKRSKVLAVIGEEEEKAKPLAELIYKYQMKEGLNNSKFAERCGVSSSYITNIYNGHSKKGSIMYLAAIAVNLKLNKAETDELLASAGFTFNKNNCEERVVYVGICEGLDPEDIIELAQEVCGIALFDF